ncbi:methyl-accepting chemotaxis protein [Paenibacillus sp. 8b26]|uniref:methyl-accepting chemotaxis protein n=1 Tax=Paenibacillus sp. 8b26 TaxID=3424133 RepID=UPI003D65DBF2
MKRFTVSLKFKLLAVLLIISMAPLIISTIFLTMKYDNALKDSTVKIQFTTASSQTEIMDRWLNTKIITMQEALKQNKMIFESGDINRILPILKMLKATDADNISFSFTDTKGMAYGSDGVNTDLSYMLDTYKQQKDLQISDVIQDPQLNLIIITVPVLDGQGGFKGVISSYLNVNVLLKSIGYIQLGKTGYAYLLSSNGTVLAHNKQQLIGKSFEDYASSDMKQKFKNTMLKEKTGTIQYKETDNTMMLASFGTVSQTGWRVVVTGATSEILTSADKAKNIAYLVILLTSIAVGLISLFASRFLLKPVLTITELMQKVASGDLSNRLIIHSQDEIGNLSRNINQMLDSFSLMIRKLKDSVRLTAEASDRLNLISEESVQTSKEITTSVVSVTKGSEDQYSNSQMSAKAMEEIAEAIQQIADSSSTIWSNAKHVTET